MAAEYVEKDSRGTSLKEYLLIDIVWGPCLISLDSPLNSWTHLQQVGEKLTKGDSLETVAMSQLYFKRLSPAARACEVPISSKKYLQ
jgi:hypothetical protein